MCFGKREVLDSAESGREVVSRWLPSDKRRVLGLNGCGGCGRKLPVIRHS